MAENDSCLCCFCGKVKSVRQIKSFQYGRKSMRNVGICNVCYSRFGVFAR